MQHDLLHVVLHNCRLPTWNYSDFNAIVAWLGLNSWLQTKGYPLLSAQEEDRQFLARLANGPPPTKLLVLESRLLAAVGA